MREVDLIALAGLLHDIGKFGQRVGLKKDEGNMQLYCPFRKEGGYFTHQHALFTAKIVDDFESIGLLSKKELRQKPFLEDDSFTNAAAMHHKPSTLLQWIVAIADRVSSGFERESFDEYNQSDDKRSYLQARLVVPFGDFEATENPYRYKLQPINAKEIISGNNSEIEPGDNPEAIAEYKKLYDAFLEDAKKIKQGNLLEKIDTLLETYTTFIPSATAFGTKPNVSLYDHLKSTSAFASALYRYHHHEIEEGVLIDINSEAEWKKKKFLVISGDFFGIQKFIFSGAVENNKALAKTLRGKSAMVSIVTELAALKLVQELGLASTSVIQNVAGKFMIIADNTPETIDKLKKTKKSLTEWFLKNTYGESGIGIVYAEASCHDFSHKKLHALQEVIRYKLEDIKSRKFDLTHLENPVFTHYLDELKDHDICTSCAIRPATKEDLCSLCDTYKTLGAKLANSKNNRIYIYRSKGQSEALDIFGYTIAYTYQDKPYEMVYDFSPADEAGNVFTGYPKRTFKAYIPTTIDQDGIEIPKTFEEIAASATGKAALAVLKADIDNLGTIFIEKLPNSQKPNFAKYNMVSRLINNFFTIHLPYLLRKRFPNIYTVFAGGDDLFLIGAWDEVMQFAKEFKEAFHTYFIAEASQMSFSASITMVKPSTPIGFQARESEAQLDEAKKTKEKNTIRIFHNNILYPDFLTLLEKSDYLKVQRERFDLSTGFVYALIQLAHMREEDHQIENTLWRSKLRYLGHRNVVEKTQKERREEAEALIVKIGNDIQEYGKRYEVALFTNLYEERKNA